MSSDSPWLFVTLTDARDDGSWVRAFLGDALALSVVAVGAQSVEHDLRRARSELPQVEHAVVGIDQRFMGFLRKRAVDTLRELGLVLPALVHPAAYVSKQAVLGQGVRVAAGAVVEAGCAVADHSAVLERAVLSAGSRVGTFTTLAQGVLLGEGTTVGDHCWLQAGLCVEPRTQIGAHCELGPAGIARGQIAEGTIQLEGLQAPARIYRFGKA